eukprot:3199105-Karenia_brevis.AAC.1
MRQDSGTIVLSERLVAKNVQGLYQHFSVRCAGKYFLIQHLSRHTGTIDKPKALAAMIVVIQNAPIRTVGRVLAATT